MVDQKLQRTLTLWDCVALAVGSIAGSGILYLPSLTYVLAGHDVLLVWLAGGLRPHHHAAQRGQLALGDVTAHLHLCPQAPAGLVCPP